MTEKEKVESIIAELELTALLIDKKLSEMNVSHPQLEEVVELFKNEIQRYKSLIQKLF